MSEKIVRITEIQQAESVSNGARLLGVDASNKEKLFPAMVFRGTDGVGIANIVKVEDLPNGDANWQITYQDGRTPTVFTLKKGEKGDKGDTGNGFAIRRIFNSAIEMVTAAASIDTGVMCAVLTQAGADVYIRNPEQTATGHHQQGFTFFTTLSDASVIRGEKGDKGDKGDTGATPTIAMGLVSAIDYDTFVQLTPQELQQLVQITGDGHLNVVVISGPRGVAGRDGDSISSLERDAIQWAHDNQNKLFGYVDFRVTTHVDSQSGETVTDQFIYFYKDEQSAPEAGVTPTTDDYICRLDAAAFVKDGMVSSVAVENGYLVITFNTAAGKLPISIALTDIFNPALYYTKQDIDNKNFATADGVYDNMTVGFAKNLLGRETDSVVDDSSFTFRSTAGTTSIAENAVAILSSIKGNLTRENGVLYPFTATAFRAIGLNAFNKANTEQQRAGYKIDNSGNIVADADYTLVWLHCLEGTSGSGYNNGYIVKLCGDSHSATLGNVGFSATKPTAETTSVTRLTASSNNNSTSYLPTTAGWLLVSVPTANLADLCVHLAWSGYNDSYTVFKEYAESVINFAAAVPNVWGMGKVGSVSDEINFAEQKAYRRVGRVYMQDLNWTAKYEEQEVEGETVQVLVGYTTNDIANTIKASTLNIAADTISGVTGYTADANGTITAYTTTETIFSGALFFELAAPDELPISVAGNYTSDDFGTEEFTGTTTDGYATIKYNTNLIDSIRSMVNSGVTFNGQTLTSFNGTILADSDYELGTISALNVQHIQTGGFFESNVFFTAGSGFALTLPSGTKLIGDLPTFTQGGEYVLSVYKGRVTVAGITTTA